MTTLRMAENVVVHHRGGWYTTTRAPRTERYGMRLAQHGYVCVAGEDRVMHEAAWPARLHDVAVTTA